MASPLESSVTHHATAGRQTAGAVLRRDRALWVALAVLSVAVVPYLLPILTADAFARWRYVLADIPVAVAALFAMVLGAHRVGSAAERHFWRLLALAFGAILAAELGNALLPDAAFTPLVELLLRSAFLVFYGALVLAAAASQGGASDQDLWNLHRLRSVGLGVLGVGFLVYFDAVPFDAGVDTLSPWYPGLFLYTALDVAVVLIFLRALQRHEDPRWRGILTGMAVVTALYAIVDGWEAILYLEPFQGSEIVPGWDLAWFVPPLFAIVVARRYLGDPHGAAEPVVKVRPKPDRGLLVVGLFAAPLAHLGLYYLGVLDPEFRQTREGVVALVVLVMGGITLVYFRWLERQRATSQRNLSLSEERYRSFVQTRSDGIYRAEVRPPISTALDPEAQIEELSSVRIAEVKDVPHLPAGVPAGQVGGSLVELFPQGSLWREGLRRWIESAYCIELEVVHEDPDGERWYYRYGLTGIVEDGQLVRVWLARSDITPKRRADEATERLTRELEQSRKLESLGTLAGGLAHDFNNLLAPIVGYTQLAREAIDRNEPDAGKNLDQVLTASKRAADLVEQVLLVSQDRPRRRVPVRMQETVRAAVKLVRTGLPPSIEMATEVAEDSPPVLGDASRLHQVVLNLCTNAAQAIGQEKGRIEVRLSHEADDPSGDSPLGWVIMEVQDNGPGVIEPIRKRVFEPFFTTNPPGEGPGLGLSVVHGIVTSHGGSVTFDSEPGLGTVVRMRFPATSRVRLHERPPQKSLRRSLSVLVVDDEEAVAEVTRSILEAYGHSVTSVTDPYMALKELRDRPRHFDVILTDYSMPGLTGLDLVDAIRDLAPGAGVVLSSGYNLTDRHLNDGVIHLAKPFTTAQLADTVLRAKAMVGPDTDT